jgi:ribosomal protein L34E
MPRRAAAPPTVAALLIRLEGLEQRLLQLETGRVGPGDGRVAVVKKARPVLRCPGCGLPLRRRKGRCAACKRPLDSI